MYDALAPAVGRPPAGAGGGSAAPGGLRPGRATRPRPVGTRRRRCWPARAGPAISASAASGTRIRVRPPWPAAPGGRDGVLSRRRLRGADHGHGERWAMVVGLAQPCPGRGCRRPGHRDAARPGGTDRRGGGAGRDHVRHRRRRDQGGYRAVDGPAGVVVLMDLGSAVLSAELALDLLADPSMRDRVTLSPAPDRRGTGRRACRRRGWRRPGRGRGGGRGGADGKERAPRPARARRRADDAEPDEAEVVAVCRSARRTGCTPARPRGWSARFVGWTRRCWCAT